MRIVRSDIDGEESTIGQEKRLDPDGRGVSSWLVNERRIIPPLVKLLQESRDLGQFDLMRAATEVLDHVLEAGTLESERDLGDINPYIDIEPIDWLGAFELWEAVSDNQDGELAKEAGRLFDSFFIPNNTE